MSDNTENKNIYLIAQGCLKTFSNGYNGKDLEIFQEGMQVVIDHITIFSEKGFLQEMTRQLSDSGQKMIDDFLFSENIKRLKNEMSELILEINKDNSVVIKKAIFEALKEKAALLNQFLLKGSQDYNDKILASLSRHHFPDLPF